MHCQKTVHKKDKKGKMLHAYSDKMLQVCNSSGCCIAQNALKRNDQTKRLELIGETCEVIA